MTFMSDSRPPAKPPPRAHNSVYARFARPLLAPPKRPLGPVVSAWVVGAGVSPAAESYFQNKTERGDSPPGLAMGWVELPARLHAQVKAAYALRGIKMKDMVRTLLEQECGKQ